MKIILSLFLLPSVGLFDAVEAGWSRPQVGAARMAWEGALLDESAGELSWFPSLTLTAQGSRQDSLENRSTAIANFGGVPFEVDLGLGETSGSLSLALVYPLWTGGLANAQFQLNKAAALGAQREWERTLRLAGLNGGLAWIDLWLATEAMALSEQRVQTATALFEDTVLQVEAGRMSPFDQLRIESDLLGARESLSVTEADLLAARVRFSQATGWNVDEVVLGDLPLLPQDVTFSPASNRLGPLVAQAHWSLTTLSLDLIKDRPSLTLSTSASHPLNEQGFSTGDTLGTSLALSWPLLDASEKRRLEAARARESSAKATWEQVLDEEAAFVATSLARLATYPSRMEAANRRHTLALKAAEIASIGRTAGTLSFLDWKGAEDEALAAGLARATLVATWWRDWLSLSAGDPTPMETLLQRN
ncbi:TolC family protein [bacterium]|nr:TolC family protein [bacterium]